ncbi:MAG: cytidylate kinase [Verrucomicrobia bacterium 13_2_20CM_2_54_15_9cls]|nr:MAG: cytidylate kinase [Verrucomicrobia bacterium 13_2_20CM_2_54_15_9cls]
MHSSQRDFHWVVAIDGPAASGKSSVARELARRLGFVYANSGAIYRAITWHLLEKGITAEDFDGVVQALESASITSCLLGGESRILIDNVDPAEHLRDSRVNESVARVSRLPAVREIVAKKLHDNARSDDLVVEGRDIGSVVFPNTPYKFYVDASPEVRLQRRAAQGERDEIALRDHADSSRPVSPLVIAKDAHVIDTSHLTVEKVVCEILARLKETGLWI